ncbi:MAG TPA: aquaporin [Thermoleophilaceae bacterium]|nr:aquaporin [Thermoleophilaceae bacterium]
MQERGPSAYIAEFIGTLMLVLFVTLAVSLYVTPASATNPNPYIDFGVIGLVHVFVLFVLIQGLAIVSGAHFNPAVTAALAFLRQIRPADAGIYVVVQLAGGVLGALLTKLLLNNFQNADDVNYGAVGISDRLDGSTLLGMLAEGIGTFVLVFAIIGVAVNPRGLKDWAGFAIGAALGLAVMVLAPLTGAGLNPARAFGPALVSGEFGGADTFLLAYVLAPVIGALVAVMAYVGIYREPGKKEPGGMEPVG